MTAAVVIFSNSLYSQDKEQQPFIVSIIPDSLFASYDYSQTIFLTVSVSSKLFGDPTESAIKDLQKLIIETCNLNKYDGFILNQMVFAKPFDEGKLIAYGTLIKKKIKNIIK